MQILKVNTKRLAIMMLAVAGAVNVPAQKMIKDDEQFKQWRSMETGPLDFEPASYYYAHHSDHSYLYNGFGLLNHTGKYEPYAYFDYTWHWRGFKSWYDYELVESKSKAVPLSVLRGLYLAEATEEASSMKEMMQKIEHQRDEEVMREADRAVDAAYMVYSKVIEGYKTDIKRICTEATAKMTIKKQASMTQVFDYILNKYELYNEQFRTIHNTSLLENTRRMQAYEIIKEEFKGLYQYAVVAKNELEMHIRKDELGV